MSTRVPGFQSFCMFFPHHLSLAKVANSSIRVKKTEGSEVIFYHYSFLNTNKAVLICTDCTS